MKYLPYSKSFSSPEEFKDSIPQIKHSFASYFHSNENKHQKCDRVKDVILNSDRPLCFSPRDSNTVILDNDSTGQSANLFLSLIKEYNFPCEITLSLNGKQHFYFHFPNPLFKTRFTSLFRTKRLKAKENPDGLAYDLLTDNMVCYEGFGENKDSACFYQEIEGEWTEKLFERFCNEMSVLIGSSNERNKVVFNKEGYSRVYYLNDNVIETCRDLVEYYDKNKSDLQNLFEIYKNKISSYLIPHYIHDNLNRCLKFHILAKDFKPLKGENIEIARNNTLFMIRQHLIQCGVTDASCIKSTLFILQLLLFENPYEMEEIEFTSGVASIDVIEKEVKKYPLEYISKYIKENPESLLSNLYLNIDVKNNETGRILEVYFDENNDYRIEIVQDVGSARKIIEANPIYRARYMSYDVKRDCYLWPKGWSVNALPAARVIFRGDVYINTEPFLEKGPDFLIINMGVNTHSKVARNYKKYEGPSSCDVNLEYIKEKCPTVYKALVNTSSDRSLKRWAPIIHAWKKSLLYGAPLHYNLILSGPGGCGKTLACSGIFQRAYQDPVDVDDFRKYNTREKLAQQNDYIARLKGLTVFNTDMTDLVRNDWDYFLESGFLFVEEIGKIPKGQSASDLVEEYTEHLKRYTRSGSAFTARRKFMADQQVKSLLSLNIACINKLDIKLDNEDNRRAVLFESTPIFKLDEGEHVYRKRLDVEFPLFFHIVMRTDFFDKLAKGMDHNLPATWDAHSEQTEEDLDLGEGISLLRPIFSWIEKKGKDLSGVFEEIFKEQDLDSLPLSIKYIYLSGCTPLLDTSQEEAVRSAVGKAIDLPLTRASSFQVNKLYTLIRRDLEKYNVFSNDASAIVENFKRLKVKGLFRSDSSRNDRQLGLITKKE